MAPLSRRMARNAAAVAGLTAALVALAVEAFATVAGHAPSAPALVAFVAASAVLGAGVATWMVMRVDRVRRLLGLQPRGDRLR